MSGKLAHSTARDIRTLEGAWAELVGRTPRPRFTQRWEWHRAAADHLVTDVTYHVFRRRNRLVSVIPLVRAGAGVMELPHHREMFVADVPLDSGAAWDESVPAMVHALESDTPGGLDAIHFRGLSPGSGFLNALLIWGHHVRLAPLEGTTFCRCVGGDSLPGLSARHLRNVDRLCRRARDRHGAVERAIFRLPGELAAGLDTFIRVESAGWKGPRGEGTSLSCLPRERAFYRALLAGFGRTGDARVEILLVGGAAVAALIALRTGGVWSILKIGYDEAYGDVGPGNLLLKVFLEEMARDPGIQEVSLVTAPPWAARWHMSWEPTYQVKVFNTSLWGRMLEARHAVHRAVGRPAAPAAPAGAV